MFTTAPRSLVRPGLAVGGRQPQAPMLAARRPPTSALPQMPARPRCTKRSASQDDTIMKGFPPAPNDQVTLKNWLLPGRLRWAQRHFHELAPSHHIKAPAHATRFGRGRALDLKQVKFTGTDGQQKSVADLLHSDDTDALLLVHRNRIVGEHYMHGMDETMPHSCMSATKSVVGLVAAKLIADGVLDPDKEVEHYVPEMAGHGYAKATIKQLLEMRSGVQWGGSDSIRSMGWESGLAEGLQSVVPQLREMLAMPAKNRNYLLATALEGELPHPTWPPWGEKKGIYRNVQQARKLANHGRQFNYRAGETNMLGWVCERATGVRMADLIERHLWQPLGMEADTQIVVDETGTAMHEGGLMLTLRDAGRLGSVLLKGRNLAGRQVLPSPWLDDARRLEPENKAAGGVFIGEPFEQGGFRNHLWVPNPERGSLLAFGANGQIIYADPQSDLVAVVFSSWPAAMSRTSTDWLRAFEAIGDAVSATAAAE